MALTAGPLVTHQTQPKDPPFSTKDPPERLNCSQSYLVAVLRRLCVARVKDMSDPMTLWLHYFWAS